METTLTVKQLRDLGILDKVIDYLKLNPYSLNEGLLKDDDELTFDSEFKDKEENSKISKFRIYGGVFTQGYYEYNETINLEDLRKTHLLESEHMDVIFDDNSIINIR